METTRTGIQIAPFQKFGCLQLSKTVFVNKKYNKIQNTTTNVSFSARTCDDPPPDPYLGMDLLWPHKSTELGSRLTYRCPYRSGTDMLQLKRKKTMKIKL